MRRLRASGRVGEAVIPESYFFWHTTGTAGTIAAGAAAANALGLDAQQTLMCTAAPVHRQQACGSF